MMRARSRAAARRPRLARSVVAQLLAGAGCRPLPSFGNFVYTELPGPASDLADQLAAEGVLVRSLEAFGAPSGLRVTVGSAEEHEALRAALAAVGQGWRLSAGPAPAGRPPTR